MTIFEAYNSCKKRLDAAGIEDYIFEAREIIKHITGLSSAQILTSYNRKLSEYQENNMIAILHQREVRYPLQYIFTKWGFYGREFYVGPGVLVPRADTETVIEECKDFLNGKQSPEILDLCAGSGCIGITLGKEFETAKVLMIEKFDEALNYAQKNITHNKAENVTALKGDIFESAGADKSYDLIVSNPPYIPQSEMDIVSPETKFEPQTALLADDGGMEFYKAIIANYADSLNQGGMLCFEVGFSQSKQVAEFLKNAGFVDIKVKNDFNDIGRAVSGIKN
jgi:release factor glutamine methyltransferase